MRVFIILSIFLMTSGSVMATTWTVSNVTNRPAQFNNLSDAHEAAQNGDTILVYGGGASYGNFTLQKSLYLIGEGMGPSVPTPSISTLELDYVSPSLNSSGSIVEGFDITSNLKFTSWEDHIDVSVKRCNVSQVTMSNYYENVLEDIHFIQCRIHGNFHLSYPIGQLQNLLIENCVLSDLYFYGTSVDAQGQIIFRNNLFINRNSSVFGNSREGVILENNIFFGAEPTGLNYSVFNHNLTFFCTANDMPPAGNENQGQFNIVNQDPMFANYPNSGGEFSWEHDYSLLSGSPAIGAGTYGTDIGLTGGNYPIETNLIHHPATPAVVSVNLPTTAVPIGGELQISVQAISRD